MLNCEQAVQLISRALDRQAGWLDRLRLRVHLLICRGCARYGAQVRLLDGLCARLAHSEAEEALSEAGLDPEARERIRRSLSG